ncbi:winged helix-turn-helix domain-containing protein [Actinopolymorpha sp. B9G3]|uniref:winged helix-turn-helix domain-containing protein n=1 Tax=Actinopolymorpha sp. B9G3 TaxID=3158970 RepID=UPI0032D955DC
MPSEKGRSDDAHDNGGTDPRALRAVAHPVRLDLLYLLRREGPLTASRCAEFLGLTPKVCSYHLNLLGKYGLTEETGEGKGRARPWRLRPTGLSYVHRPGEGRAAASAADEFARTLLARDAQQVEAFIEGRHALPSAWRNVATMSSNPLRLTRQQLAALGAELFEVLERYTQLSGSPEAGAHPVHVAMYAVPVDLTELA